MLIVISLFFANQGGPAVLIPSAVGVALSLQSLITNYEFSLADIISMKAHLLLDALAGFLLLISPWAIGFAEIVWAPHVIIGTVEIG